MITSHKGLLSKCRSPNVPGSIVRPGRFSSIIIEWIKENFEMDGDLVHSEVSKMIISEELKASWDEPTNSLGKIHTVCDIQCNILNVAVNNHNIFV